MGVVFRPNIDTVRRINVCLIIGNDSHPTLSEILDDIDEDIESEVEWADYSPSLDLQVMEGSKHGQFRLGRVCDPERVDNPLLRSWLRICHDEHGDICQTMSWSGSDYCNLRLIDVNRRCAVDAPAECHYLALSYTWGDTALVKHLKLTTARKQFFGIEGALREENAEVPRTIKDAMHLTKDLGERFLWVDALCIIQDDSSDLESQCANMYRIYASAKLTIVAGYGQDAWAGLPGVGSVPILRSSQQVTTALHESLCIGVALCDYETWMMTLAWNTRAWTYQEQICSRRLLILTGQQVFFHCETSLWYEDTALENSGSQVTQLSKFDKTSSVLLETPWLAYCKVAMKFSARKIADRKDMLRAFRGLENYLAPNITSGFVFGLPEEGFDAAISWRRFHKEPPYRIPTFPTWSWLGWKFASENLHIPDVNRVWRVGTFRKYSEELQDYLTIESHIKTCTLFQPPAGLPPSISLATEESMIPKAHLLQIWTSTAAIRVDKAESKLIDPHEQPEFLEHAVYAMRDAAENEIGFIVLDQAWRLSRPDRLEFCVLSGTSEHVAGKDENGATHVDVLSLDGGRSFANRSRQLSFRLSDWMKCEPVWKWITLA